MATISSSRYYGWVKTYREFFHNGTGVERGMIRLMRRSRYQVPLSPEAGERGDVRAAPRNDKVTL
jgi:hypothetical protein